MTGTVAHDRQSIIQGKDGTEKGRFIQNNTETIQGK